MNQDSTLWIVLAWIALSVIVGFIGQDRRIGFVMAMLAAIVFSPVIGAIIASMSRNNEDIQREIQQNDNSLAQLRLLKKMLLNQGSTHEEIDEIIEKGNKKKEKPKNILNKLNESF